MWENVKVYVIQMCLKKYAPMAVMAAFAALGTFMAAHTGMLEQYGITYFTWPLHVDPNAAPSGPCILLELDTMSTATITAVAALVTVAIRAIQHHSTGTPVTPDATKGA